MKEKRRRLKPLLARLHREFNVSAAELDRQDAWQEAVLGCALISNDPGFTDRSLRNIARWIEISWPDVSVMDDHIDLL